MVGKRIVIFGGAGSIGSELTRQLAKKNKIFIVDIDETRTYDLREELRWKGHWVHSMTGDIRNTYHVYDVFSDFKPEIVINCAALKHVEPAEEYPQQYYDTNLYGTINIYNEAVKWNIKKFIFISTDKVTDDISIMGNSKSAAETFIRNRGRRNGKTVVVRFGNVMNSRGSVLEIWKRQFENKEPLTITHPDMERYMMSIPQACELVIEAGKRGNRGELWIMRMGEPIKIIDLKEQIYGKKYPIKIIGLRKGERMSEKLMTLDEEKRAVKKDKFWIIP